MYDLQLIYKLKTSMGAAKKQVFYVQKTLYFVHIIIDHYLYSKITHYMIINLYTE